MGELIMAVAGFCITGIIGYTASQLLNNSMEHKESHEILKEGMQKLLKSQVLDIYNRAKTKGVIGEHEKDVANELYDVYHIMGGNGYMKEIKDKINDL